MSMDIRDAESVMLKSQCDDADDLRIVKGIRNALLIVTPFWLALLWWCW